MIKKIVAIKKLNDNDLIQSDLHYWLSRPPEERISAVEILRRQYNGNTAGLQRTVSIINQV